MRKLLARAAICGVALQLLFAASAMAGTVEYDWVRTLGSRVNWVETISLPKFTGDPALLTGIDISLDTSMDCEIGVENLADTASDLSVDLSITSKVVHNGVTLASKTYQRAYTYTAVPADDGNLDWQGDAGRKFQHFLFEDPPAITYSVPSALFSEFIYSGSGPTTIDFQVSALRDYWVPTSTHGSMAAYYKADAPASVKVTYHFVPEPTSIATLLVGVAGAAGFALRRRAC